MLISPIEEEEPCCFGSFSSGALLQTSVHWGRDSAEAAGCGFPDSFGNGLVVTHGHQQHIFGYYIKLPSAMLTEPEGSHMSSMLS